MILAALQTIRSKLRSFLPSVHCRGWRASWLMVALLPCVSVADDAKQLTGQASAAVDADWIDRLPAKVKNSILWRADHESGNLSQWQPTDCKYPGGGVLNTGGEEVSGTATDRFAHSGTYSAKATINGAIRGKQGPRAVRLMPWTDRPWDKDGHYIPKAAYYSTWMLLPRTYNSNKYAPWDPGDGGWWNVFQFKAQDDQNVSQPVWTLNVHHDDASRTMHFGLYSPVNQPSSVDSPKLIPLPVGRWFHVEAFYQVDVGNRGKIIIWQDGKEILRAENVRTAISKSHDNAVWGVGNYTDHVAGDAKEGTSTVYFDDAIIGTQRVSLFLSR